VTCRLRIKRLRRAHDHLLPCTAAEAVAGRAGLAGTQNIRNNQSRIGGLDHVVRDDTTAGREVRRIREESLRKLKGGLRALYRTPELPGVNPLKAARAALDSAVLAAYGFSPKTDLLAARLLVLNREVAGPSQPR
jgi:hypothetical protein